MRKHFWRVALVLTLLGVFAGHAAGWLVLPWLPQLESELYNARVRAVAPGTLDDRIVVIDIDEKSLREKDRVAKAAGPGGVTGWPAWWQTCLKSTVSHWWLRTSSCLKRMLLRA